LGILLIISEISILTYAVLVYTDSLHDELEHARSRNFALQLGIALDGVVLLILAIKFLVISIKMKLNLKGVNPD
jgi:hypothetical protein